ncbi:hypothetical protein KU15F71_45060 [Escherichia coli]
MSAHQRILAGSFGFSQPQSLNVSFRSTERQTPNATAILKERAQALQLHAQGAVWEGENRHFLKKMLNKLESYLLILK